jgi:hypothetical protein
MERFEALSEATLRVAESGLPGFGHGDGVTVAMTKPADCNRLPKDYELGLPDAEAAGDGWVLASSVDGATIVRPAPGPCP